MFALTTLIVGGVWAALVPEAPLTPAVSDVTNSSAVLSWEAPVANGAPIDGYAVQFRATSDAEWTTVESADDDDDANQIGRKLATVNEVQKIVTRCDPGHQPDDGTFELTLNFNSISDFDKETVAITNFIPFNATAAELKEALEHLENIDKVDVSRGYDSTNGHVDGPNDDGGYSWDVTFLYDHDVLSQLPTADIPLLGVHKTSITCPWSGEGSAVAVHEQRKGTLEYAYCTDDCTYELTTLVPSTMYTFNVKAHNSYGWSETSQVCGVVWCGVVWCGVVWCAVVWCAVLCCVRFVGWLRLVGWILLLCVVSLSSLE